MGVHPELRVSTGRWASRSVLVTLHYGPIEDGRACGYWRN